MKVLLRLLPLLSLSVLLTACEVEEPADDPAAADSTAAAPYVHAASDIEAGRYIVLIGGCNDCHTLGFMETPANIPEAQWLTGAPIGFRGPWGTTYPRNLRLTVQTMDEELWVSTLRTRHALPPMPWYNVNQMSERDARALYRYIRSLGPAGQPAPEVVPPGQEPATPYFDFVPQHLERMPSMPPGTTPGAPGQPVPEGAPTTPTPAAPVDSTQP